MEHLTSILNFWWVIPILLSLVFYKLIFRLFGIVIVPEDKIGLVIKKFVLFGKNKQLSGDRIIATNGEAGYQAKTLAPGVHFWFWPWQYEIDMQKLTVIPEGQIGLVNAKDGQIIKTGRILARKVECNNYQDAEAFINNGGQKGRQSAFIPNGVYKINTLLFEVSTVPQAHIQDNMVGVVTTLDGEPLPTGDGTIAGKEIDNSLHRNFQDFDAFLEAGGNRGLQHQIIQAGSYNLNPWAVQVEEQPMTEVPIGWCGVVMSYYGEEGVDVTGENFKHGNLVAKGQKGVWVDPLNPGKYPINKYTTKVEIVPTTNLVLNWANARTESHNLDKGLSTITVRSKDGFPFNLDVSQIIHIPMLEAPKVIARFGNMNNLVSQVLEPTIGNYFRNSAQNSDAISFLSARETRQNEAKQHISTVLDQYNVHAVDTLIGDITPPESLMKTLTDRKIAQEQEVTYEGQKKAQIQRQTLEKETAIADMQREVVKAEQGVMIAERTADAVVKKQKGDSQAVKIAAEADAEATSLRAKAESTRIALTGQAESEKILAIGKSNAEAYRLAVEAMGQDNFTTYKMTEEIGKSGIKLMPELLINGGGSGNGSSIEGLLGLEILSKMGKKVNPTETPALEQPTETSTKKK
jgi:regulator of protease activity HflC (stomatin/prohibitin superfamily)